MFAVGTHKAGEYIVQIDDADQGRLAELAAYFVIPKDDAFIAVWHRGLASILIQCKQEKAEFARKKESDQSKTDDP